MFSYACGLPSVLKITTQNVHLVYSGKKAKRAGIGLVVRFWGTVSDKVELGGHNQNEQRAVPLRRHSLLGMLNTTRMENAINSLWKAGKGCGFYRFLLLLLFLWRMLSHFPAEPSSSHCPLRAAMSVPARIPLQPCPDPSPSLPASRCTAIGQRFGVFL